MTGSPSTGAYWRVIRAGCFPAFQWEATQRGNVKVLNDTADFYRFFDATPHAEFLYECVRQTIEQDLPNEANFLRNFDRFRIGIENMIDMPERTLNKLFGFLRQNQGRLSRRAKEGEFAGLTVDEISKIEQLFADSFGESGAASD